ncbi:4-hydroxy-3-methylbut-2-enyl diphosphate reductase [Sphingorhabdus lutea]|uniref:4-hydroxy-3-methylbut-2-enyl diphosphate reductase n=1 Tax=Sphingorhabdus lutea TaxID=1913578 RepID=A0A1L3JCZ3_9SPHN|nr:4-hydroxy-3-methylbut-2-enyl diphosphate reductase [Sphingorhabdus lutea]
MTDSTKMPMKILLAAPRGFCAGVDRAIKIVELALKKHGAPVYVRHEIVHNKYVVDDLRAKGAIFVEELDEVPSGAHVIFSAHGVPKSVPIDAQNRNLEYFDATCPLVSKVHRQAERQVAAGRHILFIGHANHPEVIGTFGQVANGMMTLIETKEDAEKIEVQDPENLAFLTQTTLSVDDTTEIINILQTRFPQIVAPKGEDICYATSNRQDAVKKIARNSDVLLVIGAPNSSNSMRLVELAARMGCEAKLVQRADEILFNWPESVKVIGLTAGASAPEILVQEVIDRIATKYELEIETIQTVEENIAFKLPKQLETAA